VPGKKGRSAEGATDGGKGHGRLVSALRKKTAEWYIRRMPFWARIGSGGILALTVTSLCQPLSVLAGGEPSQMEAVVAEPSAGQVRLKIVVKNGRIMEVVPLSGSPGLADSCARWVKKEWKFAASQTGTFILPFVFHHAK
jgi:hypothetical protein